MRVERHPAVLWMLLLVGGSAVAEESVVPVVFAGDGAFVEKVASFALSPDQAHAIAGKFICPGKATGFDASPTMIVGDSYVFNVPRKRSIPLTGIYIDGNSGDFECRVSSRSISTGSTTVRMSQFSSIQKIAHRAGGS